jgi:hypothetical protein
MREQGFALPAPIESENGRGWADAWYGLQHPRGLGGKG